MEEVQPMTKDDATIATMTFRARNSVGPYDTRRTWPVNVVELDTPGHRVVGFGSVLEIERLAPGRPEIVAHFSTGDVVVLYDWDTVLVWRPEIA